MMPAAKHGDPQLGIDIHLCIVPPGTPTPLPTPHMSIVFDPFDYLPFIGATVTVCGMKRATAGTGAMVVHIPPGFPFAPKPPDKDDELFMGSATVVADGDPLSHIAHPVLGCQVAGMMSPPRPRKKGPPKAMVLPTTFNLAIPNSVVVGGPPTISLMGMAFKGAFAGLGKLAKSGAFQRLRQKLFKDMKPGFLKCKVLRAEPVNILNGEVSVEQEDFALPGRIPIRWVRTYGSSSKHVGLCGLGWQTLLDIRLEVDPAGGSILMQAPGIGPLSFGAWPVALGEASAELELADGARLSDHDNEFRVTTKDDRIYHFPKHLHHGAAYRIGRISDRCGNCLEIEYRGGWPVVIRESAGRRMLVTIEQGRLLTVSLHDPHHRAEHTFVRYQYDEKGDLTAVVDALGNPYRFDYDNHRMVAHTDRNGLCFRYEYDKAHPDGWRVVHAWGEGRLYDYQFEYLDELNERRITDSLGHVSIVKLSESGLPIAEIDPLGGMTVFEYDDAGRTTAVVDPGGRRTGFEYDAAGNLLKLTGMDGAELASVYAQGKAVAVTEPTGSTWTQRWDARGLLVEQVSPLGHRSRYEYDSNGQLVGYVNARGAKTTLRFDAVGNMAEVVDPLGQRTLLAHDALGNVVAKGDALDRRVRYRYDPKGRLIGAALSDSSLIHWEYDPEDNPIRYVDEKGGETRLEYCGQGKVARRIQANGEVLAYIYDTEERLIGVRNQRGELYELKRDALGRIVEESDYWGQSRHHEYDRSGHLIASIDPLGRRINYVTDPLGRVLSRLTPEGEERFRYDASGNLVEALNECAKVTRAYDAEGRIVQETQTHADDTSFSVTNRYDEVGNRIYRATSAGNHIRCGYDLLDRLTELQINDGEAIRVTRNSLGEVTEERLTTRLTRQYVYNSRGWLTRQSLAKEGESLLAVHYEYDRVGNLTRRQDSIYGSDRYIYDPLGVVLQHVDPQARLTEYVYDAAGDQLTTALKEVEGVPATSPGSSGRTKAPAFHAGEDWFREGVHQGTRYRFDRAGNLVLKAGPHGPQLELRWDSRQRLAASITDGTRTDYGYDALGRRLYKETEGGRTRFGWDGDVLTAEAAHRAGTAARFEQEHVYYPQTMRPLARITLEGEHRIPLFYMTDPNGSPNRLVDGQGTVHWGVAYGPWGEVIAENHVSVDCRLRLPGQYADSETGLYYNRHRYFDPTIGQFVTPDPIGLVGGSNVYSYGLNTFRWSDPLGLTGVITNKFPTEDLPTDGKIIPHTVQDGKIKLDKPGQRQFDFVVTTDNRLVIGRRHHLLGDRSDVLAAGQMRISGDGRVRHIDNFSGHYRPSPAEAEGFADALRRAGVNVTGATLEVSEFIVDADGNVIRSIRVKTCRL